MIIITKTGFKVVHKNIVVELPTLQSAVKYNTRIINAERYFSKRHRTGDVSSEEKK